MNICRWKDFWFKKNDLWLIIKAVMRQDIIRVLVTVVLNIHFNEEFIF